MRRSTRSLSLALIAATPAQARPVGDPASTLLAADTEQRWVPFTLTSGNQIRFAMTLDGQPVAAILDTGVSYSVLSRASRVADAARIVPDGAATAVGGDVAIGRMATRSVTIGGLTRTGGAIGVATLPAVATGGNAPVDLLVGRDLIGGQALDIDFAARRFRLIPSGRLPFAGEIAPLTVSAERQVYETSVAMGGRRLSPMVIDTGDGSSVTLSQAAWRSAALGPRPTTTAIAYGIAGPVVSELAIVPDLLLGAVDAREVEVRIEPAGGFSQSIGAAGRIGSGFLQRYRVLLDPAAGRMILAPNPSAAAAPLRSTSGLLVGILADRLRVLHVMRGSPAEAGGWRAGETICSIDGAPIRVDYAVSRLAAWSVAAPGTVVTLGLCDGSSRRLTTRLFY